MMRIDSQRGDPPEPVQLQERRIVWLLCLVAGIHVFLFSAAYPFFNIVDEQCHFDLVVRYSQGEVPRALDPVCEEASLYISIYGTPEYFWTKEDFPNGVPPPLWVQPEQMMPHVLKTQDYWRHHLNPEVTHPPLYYAIAGFFWQLAKLLGLSDGSLLYSVRFLNILFVTALVWVAYACGRLIFPGDAFVRLGVPTLVAFLPQTTFYSINNDVLLPLTSGVAFLGVIRFLQSDAPSIRLGAVTGLALAATYLTKLSSLPVIAVALCAVAFKSWRLIHAARLRATLPSLVVFAVCAGIPIGAWAVRTRHYFGDLTGTNAKVRMLGWTLKPFSEWHDHPLFSPGGLWTFISRLLSTFWQGEFLWYGKPMTFPIANTIYALLSLGFLCAALVYLWPRFATTTSSQRQALWLSAGMIAASFAFLALLSVMYDFHECFYPSREHPFFSSGRLMSAALIPFLLLFVHGMNGLLKRVTGPRGRWIGLIGLVLFMLITEIAVAWPVFPNPYNWFHL